MRLFTENKDANPAGISDEDINRSRLYMQGYDTTIK